MTGSPSVAESIRTITRCLSTAKRILAVTHMNPDGDAIGSVIATGYIAASLGIEVRLYCESPIPPNLDWLEKSAPVVSSLTALGSWQPDLVVFLDCADEQRAGEEMAAFITACRKKEEGHLIKTVCIDHHITNPGYADVNWVDSSMSATGTMVALVAKELGIPLAGALGEAIYLALVSDTGSFSYPNTNALTMGLATEIVKNGLDLGTFTAKYENHWTLERMHLWGTLMREMKVLCGGKVVVSIVTEELLEKYNATSTDIEGYPSWLRRLAGTKVVVLARASTRKGTKISLRSMGDVDVQEIAAVFGGGGHKGAAGANMTQPPHKAAVLVLEAVCRAMGEPCCALTDCAP